MISKYSKYLLPLLLILLFVGTSSALPTATHSTLRGEMYISSTANWPSTYSTNNFEVPDGTVVFARYYVGVWASDAPNSISTTFNGYAFENNPSYYVSGMGVTWIPYDVTDYVLPGETNTATINSASWGDGRQYGSTLVVVLENESKPQIEYWVAEGLDWLHYGDYVGDEVDNSITYFNGSVDLADVQSASLYSTHLTGYNYEDFNGESLSDPADSVSGSYFNYIRWDNVKPSLEAENQIVNVGRGDDTYCSPVFHALSIEYKAADLVPVNLTPALVSANTENTMTATIENRGNKNSQPFNVSLMVDGKIVDTQFTAELASGGSTTVDLQWTPDSSADSYSLSMIADPENSVVESDESNNILNSLVGTTSATAPVAEFSADNTSGDAPLTVNFTDHSTNAPTSWAWDFDNDGTVDSTEQNPVHTYAPGGNYTINLTVTNAGGSDSEIKTDYIVVRPVVADFTATPTSGGAPLTVTFTDKSTGSTAWYWDFENDGIIDSIAQNPQHTYSTTGTYTVKLTITYAGETSSAVKTDYIMALAGPVWTAKTEWNVPYLGLTYTVPCLSDLDGDGDCDLLIGSRDGVTYGYENIGTKSSPVWAAKSEWKAPDVGYNAAPCLADLDGDGDYDLLIGLQTGETRGYENTGTKSNPIWTAKTEWNMPRIKSRATPSLADFDGDGDYDLLIGTSTGITYAYENTGTKSSPVWIAKTEWSTPDIGDGMNYAIPSSADVDGDGDYDLLIGEKNGNSYAYENTGTANGPVWTRKTEWDAPSIGTYSAPCLSDLDDDGDYDLLIGAYSGITYAYENSAVLAVSKPDLTPTSVTPPSGIFANTHVTISATIYNTGTGNADAFNATLSINDTVVDIQTVSGPASGSSALVNFSWTLEAAGDYNLKVTADPENEIDEADETNNAMTVTVTASTAPTGPDTTAPVIESVVLYPANTTAGSTINISVNVTDNVEVTEVTADEIKLIKTDGIWQGSITAPSSVGNYSLSINASDAAGNTAETSVPYHVVQLSGGANIAVSPRSSSAAAGNTVSLSIKVKNTQNIDDTFKVRISVSELPASYQADLSWFTWTETMVSLKAGEEVLIPMEVSVPSGTAAGYKLFRANVNSETSSITGFDTGYLVIS